MITLILCVFVYWMGMVSGRKRANGESWPEILSDASASVRAFVAGAVSMFSHHDKKRKPSVIEAEIVDN